jgi:D-sedoheptulose 7-phosphate isomerase
MLQKIKDIIQTSINVKKLIHSDNELIKTIDTISKIIENCYKNDGKVLFCGNGGSAADAQHLAAELSGRFYYDRPPLFAEALHVNSSYVTAVANDYSFDEIYARLVRAFGKKGDILIGLSTSGNSHNIINAFNTAKQMEIITVGFTGEDGGEIKKISDYLISIPSSDTPRIQESHIMVGHIICQLVEEKIFPHIGI